MDSPPIHTKLALEVYVSSLVLNLPEELPPPL